MQLRGLGEPLDPAEVAEVYLPLSRLLNLYVGGTKALHEVTSEFLRERVTPTPFVIGVAGSVAVGKSTIARLLRELLAVGAHAPRRARHDRRLPVPERRARATRAHGAQGLPRVVRPPGAAAVRERGQGGRRRGARRSTRTSPTTSCPTRRSPYAAPTCSSSRGSTCCSRGCRTQARGERPLRLHDLRRRPHRATSRAGTRSASSSCSAARSRTRARTSTGTRASPKTRRSPAHARSGSRSTSRTAAEHPAHAVAGVALLRKDADHAVSSVLLRKL